LLTARTIKLTEHLPPHSKGPSLRRGLLKIVGKRPPRRSSATSRTTTSTYRSLVAVSASATKRLAHDRSGPEATGTSRCEIRTATRSRFGPRRRKLFSLLLSLDFSPTRSDQLSSTRRCSTDRVGGRHVVGISVYSPMPQAFQERLSLTIPLRRLQPEGEVSRAYGACIEAVDHGNRSLVLLSGRGRDLPLVSTRPPAVAGRDPPRQPDLRRPPRLVAASRLPRRAGVSLIYERADPAPRSPADPAGTITYWGGNRGDRLRRLRLSYCAAGCARLMTAPAALLPHFPMASQHPRAAVLHAAAEAAGAQGAFCNDAIRSMTYRCTGRRPPSCGSAPGGLRPDLVPSTTTFVPMRVHTRGSAGLRQPDPRRRRRDPDRVPPTGTAGATS